MYQCLLFLRNVWARTPSRVRELRLFRSVGVKRCYRSSRYVLPIQFRPELMPACAGQQSNSVTWRNLSRIHRVTCCKKTNRCLCERHTHACICRGLRFTRTGARLPKAAPSSSHMLKASTSSQLRTPLNHDDAAPQQQRRQGSLAATDTPPTAETMSLGPRVEHLAATEDGSLLEIISEQLQLPKVIPQPAHSTIKLS